MPVQLTVSDIEEVLGAQDLTAWNAHDRHTSRLVLHFRLPVDQHIVARLLEALGQVFVLAVVPHLQCLLVLITQGRPLKVDHTLNLYTLLVKQTHRRKLIYTDTLARRDLGTVLAIAAPFEEWPTKAFHGWSVGSCRVLLKNWECA